MLFLHNISQKKIWGRSPPTPTNLYLFFSVSHPQRKKSWLRPCVYWKPYKQTVLVHIFMILFFYNLGYLWVLWPLATASKIYNYTSPSCVPKFNILIFEYLYFSSLKRFFQTFPSYLLVCCILKNICFYFFLFLFTQKNMCEMWEMTRQHVIVR